MAKVTYLDGATTQFGYVFEPGGSVEVSEEKHLAKFRGNRFFEVSETEKPGSDKLAATHVGGGAFYIMRGDERLGDKMTKEDADAFNTMSAAEKAEYLTSLTSPL